VTLSVDADDDDDGGVGCVAVDSACHEMKYTRRKVEMINKRCVLNKLSNFLMILKTFSELFALLLVSIPARLKNKNFLTQSLFFLRSARSSFSTRDFSLPLILFKLALGTKNNLSLSLFS
jgi:hypothetical protein